MMDIKNKYLRFIILVVCVVALMGIAFKAIDVSFPTGAKVDNFIDARVDKILWRYEDLIIKDDVSMYSFVNAPKKIRDMFIMEFINFASSSVSVSYQSKNLVSGNVFSLKTF